MTGISRATAAAIRRATRRPVPPGNGPPAVSRMSRSVPAARYALPASIALVATEPASVGPDAAPAASAAGRCSTFQTGRRIAAIDSTGSSPESWTTSGSIAAMAASISAAGASAKTATTRGRVPAGDAPRTTPASHEASARVRQRGVPGTRFRPMASAPERSADRTPSESVTPQILTSGCRASAATSSGTDPAADERPGRRGRIGRAHQRLSDEGGVQPDRPPADQRSGLADARFADHQAVVRHERSQAQAAAPDRPRGCAGCGC